MTRSVESTIAEPAEVAERLGVSLQAVELTRRYEVVDLHLDTFIPMRLVDYQLGARHDLGWLRGVCFGHMDLPRALDSGLSGAMWSITTNPFRTAKGRWETFLENLQHLRSVLDATEGAVRVVRTRHEYDEARAAGAHACLLSVQGGNCFDAAPNSVADVPDRLITRVTVLHLTNSALGTSSAPVSHLRGAKSRGLSTKGKEMVERMNAERVFVDLAHIHPDGFWDAVEVHDRTQPLLSTHTGVSGVRPHWRNLDDDQLKAIAATGGTVGIIFSPAFLQRKGGPTNGEMMIEHMQHIIDVVGEDFVSIGSDYDGAIIPPADFRSGDSYPRLVELMLERDWREERIAKILGQNFLRAFGEIRPE